MAEIKEKKRPLIGISGPDKGGLAAWLFTKHAVQRAGGRALRLRPGKPAPLSQLDGLIIGGGADIDPSYYGAEREKSLTTRHDNDRSLWRKTVELGFFPILFILRKLLSVKQFYHIDPERDALENELLKAALERHLPILGICRGAQLINIHFGGSLYQDLREFYQEVPRYNTVLPRITINIDPDSQLAGIMRTEQSRVNALHYQAIKDLGANLKIVAREDSGIIQAIEESNNPFLLGVQWHPEYMPQHGAQLHLFKALVAAASESKEARA